MSVATRSEDMRLGFTHSEGEENYGGWAALSVTGA
jgi:hypothetical protein